MPNTRVVMVVANDVATDTRVKKEALAVAGFGLDVTILGITSERAPGTSRMGPVVIERVPVTFERRDAARARRDRLRRKRPPAKRTLLDKVITRTWKAFDDRIATMGLGARWERIVPEVFDYARAFGPALDRMEPAVIHAHDMHVIGIADDAARRARSRDGGVRWIYDAHEYVPGLSQYGGRTARIIAAWADLESEHIKHADAIVTVSPAVGRALRTHYGLGVDPVVVLNTPVIDPPGANPPPTLRAVVGIAEDVPLLVYSGGMTTARGIHTAIEAMTLIPEAHLALVCVPHTETYFVKQLRPLAGKHGVEDRVHFVNPVAPGQVVGYLSSADVALIPAQKFPSHDMSLPNKIFEYMHAGLPVVTTELETLAAFVREHDIGEVCKVEDPADLARVTMQVLADRERYRKQLHGEGLLERYSWAEQVDHLRRVYEGILGRSLEPSNADAPIDLTERPEQ